MDRDSSQMMTIDTDLISIYQISTPMLTIKPRDPKLLYTQFSFAVKGESKNEYINSSSSVCTYIYQFIVVDNFSLALWPTGL
jgi:hypothetical protein